MLNNLRRLWKDEQAATAVEYAIMLMGIAIVIIGAVRLLGTSVNTHLQSASSAFQK